MAKKAALFLLTIIIVVTALFISGCFHQKVGDDKKSNKEKVLEEKLKKANKTISKLKKKIATESGSESKESTVSGKATSKNFGYIKRVYTSGGTTYLAIDYAQMFTGAAATRAARADGEDFEMDYYIRNKNTRLRTFAIDPGVQITAQTYNMTSTGKVEDRSITLATFKTIFQTRPSSNENMVVNPYWINLRGSTVTKIKEQYLP